MSNKAQPVQKASPATPSASAESGGGGTQVKAAPATSGSVAGASPPTGNTGAAPDAAKSVSSTTGDAAGAGSNAATPQTDPDFQAVVAKTKEVAEQQKQHDSAQTEAKEAQDAAPPPSNEVESKAQDQQVGEMNQQQPGTFNAKAFKAALMEKIAAVIPNNEKDAQDFKDRNQLDSVKQDVSSQVTQEQEQAAGPVKEKAKETPDTTGIEPKPVTPMQPPEAGAAPTDIGAERATPKPKPESEVSEPLKASSQELDQQMTQANVTDEQLEKSNEPQFQEALGAKKEVQAHANTAPQAYRQSEQATVNQAQVAAQTTSQTQLQGMHGQRKQLLTQAMGAQGETQGKDTQERAKIASEINGIYEKTKGEVEAVLTGLDTEVTSKFDAGAAVAKQKFETYVGQKMDAWKQQRYGEWYDVTGWDERASDAWNGLPPEVNKFFVDGKQAYLDSMDGTLTEIANHVAQKLNEAKQKIAEGKQKIQQYVANLPGNLWQVGQEAAQNIQGKFNQLEESVNNKQNELIDSLAQKYSESLQRVDAQIKQMKEENRGLKDKAKDAIAGTIQTILELKNMLMGVLAKASGAVEKIIKDPVQFLSNLVAGIKQGFQGFVGDIWNHLQKGLIGWLTGTLADAGVQIPTSLDLKGIFTLVMDLLGLTYAAMRGRVASKVGEKKVSALEKGFDMFIIWKNEGTAGLWKLVQDKLTNLKEMVIGGIQSFIVDTIISAGVTWVLSLLNPASAFVRACKLIIDVIMFFVERGSQIAALVNAVLDSVGAIADGAIGVAAKLVEGALAKALPVVISFLASLIGLGGISGKVRGLIEKARGLIDTAIDWVLGKALTFVKKLGGTKFGQKLKAGAAKAKDLKDRGVKKVKDLKEKGKAKLQNLKERGKKKLEDVGEKFRFGKNKAKPELEKNDKARQAEVDIPKSLVLQKPFFLKKVSPNLAQQLASALQNMMLHEGGGDPKQETKQILTQHKDAKYDRSTGQLTLPKLQQNAVESAISLDQLGKVIVSQTGVQKVLLRKEGQQIEVGVQINPYKTVGTLSFDDLAPGTGQKIVLLGEANFSFAKSLAKNIGGRGVVATSYESRDEIKQKYKTAEGNIQSAQTEGAQIVHGVDAQNIDPNLGGPPPEFQFIVFNFPFVEGDRAGASARNLQMLARFMQSASNALAKGGKVFVTSKPFWLARFHLEASAEQAGLKWVNPMDFDAKEFPSYEHRETHKDKSATGTEKAVTLIFTK